MKKGRNDKTPKIGCEKYENEKTQCEKYETEKPQREKYETENAMRNFSKVSKTKAMTSEEWIKNNNEHA